MRTFLTLLMIAAIAVPALAGGNPNVVGYIDFDPPNRVHGALPAPYATIRAYVCFGDLDMGLTSASFMLSNPGVTCPGVFAPPNFTNLLPGDLAIGNIYTGITLSSTGCEPGPEVCVGYLELFYLGGECLIELLEHPEYPGWITDCNDPAQVDIYSHLQDGTVGYIVPVEDASWGSIKAMYK